MLAWKGKYSCWQEVGACKKLCCVAGITMLMPTTRLASRREFRALAPSLRLTEHRQLHCGSRMLLTLH